MSRIYELGEMFEDLYGRLDSMDPDDAEYENMLTALFDTIEGIEGEFSQEAEALAVFIKRLLADADAMKKEKEKLAARQQACEGKAERIKHFLLLSMNKMALKKVGGIRATVSRSDGRESVAILDANRLYQNSAVIKPRVLKESDIDKTKIKELLAAGQQVPGAAIVRNPYITIK